MKILLLSVLCVAFISGSHAQCRSTNICFALDESGSIEPDNFISMSATVNVIVDRYADLAPGTFFSAVALAPSPPIISDLTSNASDFKEAIKENIQDAGGTEDIGSAFRVCANLTSQGSRQQVILLFADGEDEGSSSARETSTELQEQGITIATVGIGSGADSELLQDIASRPNLFTNVSEFSELGNSIIAITDTICISDPLLEKPSILIPLVLSLLFGGVVVISVIPAIFPLFNFSSIVGNVRKSGKSTNRKRKGKRGSGFDFRLTRYSYIRS